MPDTDEIKHLLAEIQTLRASYKDLAEQVRWYLRAEELNQPREILRQTLWAIVGEES